MCNRWIFVNPPHLYTHIFTRIDAPKMHNKNSQVQPIMSSKSQHRLKAGEYVISNTKNPDKIQKTHCFKHCATNDFACSVKGSGRGGISPPFPMWNMAAVGLRSYKGGCVVAISTTVQPTLLSIKS